MPFEKIESRGREMDTSCISIQGSHIYFSTDLMTHFPDNKTELYFDKENLLLGIKPVAQNGLSMSRRRVNLPDSFHKYNVKIGVYSVTWNGEMLIAKVETYTSP